MTSVKDSGSWLGFSPGLIGSGPSLRYTVSLCLNKSLLCFLEGGKKAIFLPELLFFFLAAQGGLWDIDSCPETEPGPLAVKAPCPNHWTTREFP